MQQLFLQGFSCNKDEHSEWAFWLAAMLPVIHGMTCILSNIFLLNQAAVHWSQCFARLTPQWRNIIHILYNGPPISTKNCPLPWGISTQSNTWCLDRIPFTIPNGISKMSAIVAGFTIRSTDWQTDRRQNGNTLWCGLTILITHLVTKTLFRLLHRIQLLLYFLHCITLVLTARQTYRRQST